MLACPNPYRQIPKKLKQNSPKKCQKRPKDFPKKADKGIDGDEANQSKGANLEKQQDKAMEKKLSEKILEVMEVEKILYKKMICKINLAKLEKIERDIEAYVKALMGKVYKLSEIHRKIFEVKNKGNR